MKKILLLAIILALFSCSSETETKDSEKEKVVNAIVDPGDPDMYIDCNDEGRPAYDYLQDGGETSVKSYIVKNDTPHTIRGTIYLFPKYTENANSNDLPGTNPPSVNFLGTPLTSLPEYYIMGDFIIPPYYCKTFMGGMGKGTNTMTAENFENFWAIHHEPSFPNNSGILKDNQFSTYTQNSLFYSLNTQFWPAIYYTHGAANQFFTFLTDYYKIAFIKYEIVDEYNAVSKPHMLALENIDVYSNHPSPLKSPIINDYMSIVTPFILPPAPIRSLDIPSPGYFTLPAEISPLGIAKHIYYMLPGVNQTNEDTYFGVKGTLRHMPFVYPPDNMPLQNPDSSPGYIIKFENL